MIITTEKEMARQSERLISLGYYARESRVSYKENLKKIFHKKRKHHLFSSDASDIESTVDETSLCNAPPSGTMTNTSVNDGEWDEYSDISHTSIGDECETLIPFDLPSASVVNETGDQSAAYTKEPPQKASNSAKQTPKKFWPKCIAICLLAISLCFSTCLCQGSCLSQMQPFNLNHWKAGDRELESVKEVQANLIQLREELAHMRSRLLPKGLSMPNFALESQGARVLHAHPSEIYWTPSQPPLIKFLGMPVSYPHLSPRIVIQDHTALLVPGRCWSFAGQSGRLFISLSEPIKVSHVTMGHISRDHTPYGFMHSAPQQFSVSGYLSKDVEGTHLGTFEYDLKGESFQTFELPNPKQTFRFVMLEILSNWGHPDYTCVYSFKVHGVKTYNSYQ